MTRFEGDGDEEFPGQWWLWEGNMRRCFSGKAGQAKLREIREALLALPQKRLIRGRLADENGDVCTVGAIALHRRVKDGQEPDVAIAELAKIVPQEMVEWDSWEVERMTLAVGADCGIKAPMVTEIAFHNDVWERRETPEECYSRILAWVENCIRGPV